MNAGGADTAVKVTYRRYLDAFHSRVAANVTPYVTTPLMVASASGVRVFEQRRDVESWLQEEILDRLAAASYDHTVMDHEQVTVLDDGMALMRVAGARLDTSGAVLERIAAMYTLVLEADDEWRIAVMMPFSPDAVAGMTAVDDEPTGD
jgi:hypothetical protein